MLNVVALFTRIIDTLLRAVGTDLARQACGPMVVRLGTQTFVAATPPSRHRPIAAEIWHLLLCRAERLGHRFRRLHARWQSGTLQPCRPAIIRPAPNGAGRMPTPRPAHLRLPRARGWINRRIAETAPCAGNLQALLYLPEMERFLAEVPRAGRLLRPLCHALAVDVPAGLRLKPRPRAPLPPPRPTPASNPPLPRDIHAPVPFREKRQA